jgi:hypothetical protein
MNRSGAIGAARAGVACALVAPVAYFVVVWFLRGGSKDGLIVAVIDSVIYGVLELAAYAFANPVQAALYLFVVWAAGRFAFRR